MYGLFLDGLCISKCESRWELEKVKTALLKYDPWMPLMWRELNPGEGLRMGCFRVPRTS